MFQMLLTAVTCTAYNVKFFSNFFFFFSLDFAAHRDSQISYTELPNLATLRLSVLIVNKRCIVLRLFYVRQQ